MIAIDDAAPPLTGTATVMINIEPQNDNSPIINNPPSKPIHIFNKYIHISSNYVGRDPYNYTLVEDMGTPIPFPLLSVDASDLDQDTLTYSFATTNVRVYAYLQCCSASIINYPSIHTLHVALVLEPIREVLS